MFHVKLAAIILLTASFTSCKTANPSVQIRDYIISPGGRELNGKNLTAFIFENNRLKPAFEQFLLVKYKNATIENEIWITIDKDKYKLIVYDYSDFDKYFGYSNYSQLNEVVQSDDIRDQRPFIAISVLDSHNADCLAPDSLLNNMVINYLEGLKQEFFNL